jgi:hypothetical protein
MGSHGFLTMKWSNRIAQGSPGWGKPSHRSESGRPNGVAGQDLRRKEQNLKQEDHKGHKDLKTEVTALVERKENPSSDALFAFFAPFAAILS